MARVLLIGSERQRAAGLRGLLARDGHHVTWVRSEQSWPSQEKQLRPDVVIAAVDRIDGILGGAAGAVRGFPPPLLFVQQEADFFRDSHLDGRLVDRLASPFMSAELLARVDALIRVRQIVGQGKTAALRQGGGSSSLRKRLSSWFRSRFPDEERPAGPYLEVAARVAEWADRRDAFEPGHAERVTSFCAMIAEALRMEERETAELLRAAMLHDIGKVALPVDVLRQQTPLAEHQRRLIRTHPARGAALLRALDPDERVARVVLYHHERPDGQGYYAKQAGGVPRAAFALAVAETYDAMTSSLHGKQVDDRTALELLQSQKGSAFDGDCVDALVDALKPRVTAIPLSPIRPLTP